MPVDHEEHDIETQPLLTHSEGNDDSRLLRQRIQRKPHWWKRFWPMWAGFLAGIATVALLVLTVQAISKNIPSDEAIQSNLAQITEVKVETLHLDGWKTQPRGGLNTEKGKYLQVSCTVQTRLNYDLLNQSTVPFTELQASWFRFFSEKGVRSVCVDVNNVTTFNNRQHEGKDDLSLGSLFILDPFCLDLHNGTINELNLTILIKPEIKNGLRVLKKIWNHNYAGLNLWSLLNVSLSKRIPFSNCALPLFSLENIKIDWNKIIDWKNVDKEVGNFREFFREDIALENIQMVDTMEGFNVQLETESFPNKWFEYIKDKIPWVEFPTKGNAMSVPELDWYVKLPDCNNDFTIELPDVTSYTDKINISKNFLSPKMNLDMVGSLPDSLINEVCNSDEENIVTPLTIFLNRLFNQTKLVEVEARGQVRDGALSNKLLPNNVLNEILNEISYVPIKQNITFNISNLIEDFIIEDMELHWTNGKLSVIGSVIGLLDLSFYETSAERFEVNNIKGNLKLYHDKKHFISLPMKTWVPSNSEIIHDAENNNSTMLKIEFDVNDKDMKILNKFELSKCFNEILFKGETNVQFDSVLDLVIDSLLGELIITGLTTSGETVVH
ncbi:hypothetical protein C6P44_005356 [Monosporozyma unispora]|nr:hypothetical protein C6P44_005356 [Kazachstania unispora]